MKRVCVFCGSNPGVREDYRLAAVALGRLLAGAGLGLVYGGGAVGLMGVIADAVLSAGGEVIGVIPQSLAQKEIAHQGLTQLHIVSGMHARKAMMAEHADAFIAMPGGFGTLEELFEVTTWAQLGLHDRPVGLLNVAGYYDGLLGFLDHAAAEGLLRPEHRGLIRASADPAALLQLLRAQRQPPLPKWISPSET
jgi:hypothetical protein